MLALLCMSTTACHALVVAGHAINALCCLCKDKLANVATAGLACEACGVVGFVASHDSFV